MKKPAYITAQEAAAELGITLATLYAYVSRGLIHSEAVSGDPRVRRYRAEDIERLKARRESRQRPEAAAESALHLGLPVLESAITLIDNGRLWYRGHDAVKLAQEATVEQVAALIWTGDLNAHIPAWSAPLEIPAAFSNTMDAIRPLSSFDRMQAFLPFAAANDAAAYDLRPASVAATGARILRYMALVFGAEDNPSDSISARMAAFLTDDPRAEPLLRAVLILCADHELNVSAFTVRCVASANATPYAAVIAGLAALGGTKHGGHTGRVEAFLREAGTPERVYETMAARLRRGEHIPGFGHPLYPDGDPRGRVLLQLVAEAYPDSEAVAFAQAASEAGRQLLGDEPTIDLGLVILTRAVGIVGEALALFAIGRTIGWIGHAIEQYPLDRLIRPRARYTGAQPLD